MQFAVSLPWWVLVLLAFAAGVVAWGSYAGSIVALRRRQRTGLILLRAAALLALIACLLRPVRNIPPEQSEAVVPILVDVSRSMGLADTDHRSRLEVAKDILGDEILPGLAGRFAPEIWTFGDILQRRAGPFGPAAPAGTDAGLTADAPRSDLSGALREIRERYRERRVAGIVVISDGGDTSAEDAAAGVDEGAVPVYSVGVGSARVGTDFEVLDVTAGDAAVTDSSVDISVSAVSRGSAAPFDLRLLENGRPVDVRRVTPAGDGSPLRAVFTVAPAKDSATLYTIEIPSASTEIVIENNRRSVAVEPPGRARRLLIVEGAPGFEHSFLKRALTADPGIELDSVVRKGRDAGGDATYFVQASAERAPLLASGFPKDRAALYVYDAVILANVEPDTLTGVQLEALAGFVGERGGGLMVLGAKSFAHQGLAGTAVEEVLPVTLSVRDGGVARTAAPGFDRFAVSMTPAGAGHPVMRIGGTAEETIGKWETLPPLAGASPLGAPRPGAQVLALVRTGDGMRPLVAVQRYGHGRSLVFGGEASWRWRMKMPSSDRRYELFWRQAARWIASAARDQVTISTSPSLVPGDEGPISAEVRNEEFAPVTDADVRLRVTAPDGGTTELRPTLADPGSGRYAANMRFDQPGLYRVSANTRRGSTGAGDAKRWVLVGAVDRELAEPRLNEEVLRRLSRATGGSYFSAGDISRLPSLLTAEAAGSGAPRVEEVWHSIWIFTLVVVLLTAEWTLRRAFGLR